MAFDVLSFVMGQKAAAESGSSSGSGENLKGYTGTAVLTGTWNETVSVDFGFLPDMLIIAPEYYNYDSDVSIGTWNYMFIGVREEVAGKLGLWVGDINKYYYYSSGKVFARYYSGIDDDYDNNAINNVSETGFTFGKTHPSGTFRITALKFT